METGFRIGLYCSDVAGAFDRVLSSLLLQKLRAANVHPFLVRLISSWLEYRIGMVVVSGCSSDPFTLCNMIFQGTVWGPCLWNLFYADVRTPVRNLVFTESVFADDLNSFKLYHADLDDETVFTDLQACQIAVHS